MSVEDRAPTDRPRPTRNAGFGTIFWVAVTVASAFVVTAVILGAPFADVLATARAWIVTRLGWLYLLLTTAFLVFVVVLACGRAGRIRLGGPDAKPEFGLFSWFAMLFQAGMGVGLLFWGVAEPALHYREPPPGLAAPGTPQAADVALQYSFFHWTLHPWAIYAVVGLAVAYAGFHRGTANLRISEVLRPVLGDRVDGAVGTAVDVLAVTATLFGVGLSLGLGTLQISAGLELLAGWDAGIVLELAVVVVTAVAYLLSACTPIKHGINRLSQLSMVLAAVLLGWFLVVGPTTLQLDLLVQDTGGYLRNLVPMSLRTNPLGSQEWLGQWTIFYWAGWIAWAPYVGAFIARISRGRTVREFVVGVLLAPSLFSIVWFSVLGGSAIDTDRRTGGAIGATAADDAGLATFRFLAEYPGFLFTAVLVLFLVWIFFVAGADAGTVVLGSMSGAGLDPPRRSKLTWGVVMAAIAACLLVVGAAADDGSAALDAMQDAAVLAATPFALLMVLVCWSLHRALRADPTLRDDGVAPGSPRSSDAPR